MTRRNVTLDADLVARMHGYTRVAPAPHPGDVEVGNACCCHRKSIGGDSGDGATGAVEQPEPVVVGGVTSIWSPAPCVAHQFGPQYPASIAAERRSLVRPGERHENIRLRRPDFDFR